MFGLALLAKWPDYLPTAMEVPDSRHPDIAALPRRDGRAVCGRKRRQCWASPSGFSGVGLRFRLRCEGARDGNQAADDHDDLQPSRRRTCDGEDSKEKQCEARPNPGDKQPSFHDEESTLLPNRLTGIVGAERQVWRARRRSSAHRHRPRLRGTGSALTCTYETRLPADAYLHAATSTLPRPSPSSPPPGFAVHRLVGSGKQGGRFRRLWNEGVQFGKHDDALLRRRLVPRAEKTAGVVSLRFTTTCGT